MQHLANKSVVEDVIRNPGAVRSDLPVAVMISCRDYTGDTLWRMDPRPGHPKGIPVIPVTPLKSLLLRLVWAITVHKLQGLTLPQIHLGLGKKEFSTSLTLVVLSRVKALSGILLVENVDYSRVKKLGGTSLAHRLEDAA
ncbi:hypothetical protein EV359DRAFT_63072 [Lentinula novae-zelandiae]|nr:hypothetical protein EV359DRAFT_63072 [Lentinula novae-zelandiae]